MSQVKLEYNGCRRRILINSQTDFEALKAKARELFAIPPSLLTTFSYSDDDGDTIPIDTDEELAACFEAWSKGCVLLHIDTVESPAEETPSVSDSFEELPPLHDIPNVDSLDDENVDGFGTSTGTGQQETKADYDSDRTNLIMTWPYPTKREIFTL